MTHEELGKRIKSEQQCMKRITNADLVCRDCMNRYDDSIREGNTSFCAAFPKAFKPDEVIKGGDCKYYVKEEE